MKFIKPVEITAEYKITTPMFLGGAFPEESLDNQIFRNASLKGALRFWWRALNWGRILTDEKGDKEKALKTLHVAEGILFGKASDGKNSVQSRVQLRTELIGAKFQPKSANLPRLGYLLGLGLYHFRDGLLRPYIEGGLLRVTVKLKLDPQAAGTNQEQEAASIKSIEKALIALGVFGGLGSRARKGFGSLAIQSIQNPTETRTFKALSDIEQFVTSLNYSAPANAPLTAFSSQTRIDCLLGGKDSLSLLADIGDEMQLYRSYGQNGKVNGENARRNFVSDHDNALKAASGEMIALLPERSVFGLPHNYFFSSNQARLDIAPEVPSMNRRASPLFIHIHQFPDGQCLAIQSLLAGQFLPKGLAVELKGGRRRNTLTDPTVKYPVIHRYLDGFQHLKGFKEHKVLRHAQ